MRRFNGIWSSKRASRIVWGLLLAGLGIVAPAGCTREFFREWANLDVSQAVFEKSRDPRFRVDLFSVDPPGLARFADPYDPDAPPAPPDDPAAEALSPVPQWPNHRLITPVEGTGYLELMDKWRRDRPVNDSEANFKPGESDSGAMPAQPENPPLPPSEAPSPFSPEMNGPDGPINPPAGDVPAPATVQPPGSQTRNNTRPKIPPPITLAGASTTPIDAAKPKSPVAKSTKSNRTDDSMAWPAKSGPTSPKSTPLLSMGNLAAATKKSSSTTTKSVAVLPLPKNASRDNAVVRTANSMQQQPPRPGDPRPDLPPQPSVGEDPNPQELDMGVPNLRRPGQMAIPPGGQLTAAQVQELAGLLVPTVRDMTDNEAAGYSKDMQSYRITMQQAFTLALINSRTYQTNLENLYGAALSVTLQRFAFQPQFYAGTSPLTSPGQGSPNGSFGFPALNPSNRFTYNTLESPGGQVSTLQLGTVAGFGKLLNSGGQLLMGFANQLVFNFVGKNPIQPTVQSSLPISFVQPFLRGAGRAVTLENLTQAERNLLYQVRLFAKFRQEFLVATLTGGQILSFSAGFNTPGFSTGGNLDPTTGFIPVLVFLQDVELDRRNLAAFEQLATLYRELIKGEASGLSQLQVDQVELTLAGARQTFVSDKINYRNSLDAFKQQLGMPPDTPLVLDRSLLKPFTKVFDDIETWQRNPKREMDELNAIAAKLPELEDLIVDGRSVLSFYKNYRSDSTLFEKENEDGLEALLVAAGRVAMEYRLDLMNQRAQLYDAWRKIAVTANALKGYLNVAITNQILTPPNTTNPFAFVDQAKQFSLVFNAELPLVRVAERNTFRAALISYQQARRQLQYFEDYIKTTLRQDIRNLQNEYVQYEISRRNFILSARLRDQSFEAIIQPPQGGTGGGGVGQAANAATQTNNLLNYQRNLILSEYQVVLNWQQYQLARLTLYRDLGTLPYDEWEAFSELFPSQYSGPSLGPPTHDAGPSSIATSTTSAAEAVTR